MRSTNASSVEPLSDWCVVTIVLSPVLELFLHHGRFCLVGHDSLAGASFRIGVQRYLPAHGLDDAHPSIICTAVVESHGNVGRGLMRASGGLEGNGEGQGGLYCLTQTVGLRDSDPLTADTDAVVERRTRVEVIALGQLQVDQNLPSDTRLHLLWRHLYDCLVAKIGVAEASHSHRRCQTTQG